ncbi:MAG: tetratricopeptide repeat protein [Desertimonas sp.]
MNARRQPRPERTPAEERERLAERTTEAWIDEGDVRGEASRAASRAQQTRRRSTPRAIAPADADQIGGAVSDRRRAGVLAERLAAAQHALDRDRLDEARRIALPIAREAPGVAAVHELLGLVAYRSGRWKQAVTELEQAQVLRPNVELLPVVADSYRGLSRWRDVERIWDELKALSPAQEVLAEGRIVAAGALADRGEIGAALDVMSKATATPKRVRPHHLRQWYVIADLHDRAGDALEATRWFERVAHHDLDFVDVADRLRALGR